MTFEDKKRIEEIKILHAIIVRIEQKHLDLRDHISRNAAMEYVEGMTFLLARLDEAHTALREIASPHRLQDTTALTSYPPQNAAVWEIQRIARKALGEE